MMQCKIAIGMNANSAVAHVILGFIYRETGMYDQAKAEFQHALSLTEDKWYIKSAIGITCAIRGKKDEAKKILEELRQQARGSYVSPIDIAALHIALGDTDQALASLEKAYQERSDLLAYLQVDPTYDSIRSEPRFRDLLRRVGLST